MDLVIVGVDTGGTFTDLVARDRTGRIHTHKVASTPDDPSRAILRGLRELADSTDDHGLDGIGEILHGTTVGTNALLERKGARTVLVTTEGFRDVLEIARQDRPDLYDIYVTRPDPLVPRTRRLEVPERIAPDGMVITPLTQAALESLVARVAAARPEAIAIALLFSYVDDSHERTIESALAERLSVPISRSSDILPEHREYERTATTVANATLQPVLARYIGNLDRALGQRRRALRIMQSNGGLITAATAARYPVHTVFSGPAGGVIGAARVGRDIGRPRLMTFDMGGTSTDVSLVDGGAPSTTSDFAIAGTPIRVPVIDIHTVGAGGGSIARVDLGGALRVGPESAGADPGPACYGTGRQATVTDAHVVLGRLQPELFLGGRMTLAPERSQDAVETLARKAGLSPARTALGILEVVNATMERALKQISLQRGHDPELFTLVSFGGAGGLHAVDLARGLGMKEVLVPTDPGLLSAHGLLAADVIRDTTWTCLRRASATSIAWLRQHFAPLKRSARHELRDEGVAARSITLNAALDLRYLGQSYELTLPWNERDDLVAAFHALHEKAFGTRNPHHEVEVVALRVRASGPAPHIAKTKAKATTKTRARRPPRRAPRRARALRHDVLFAGEAHAVPTPFHQREACPPGTRLKGPAVIVEMSATTVIPPGATARVDRSGHILITP